MWLVKEKGNFGVCVNEGDLIKVVWVLLCLLTCCFNIQD